MCCTWKCSELFQQNRQEGTQKTIYTNSFIVTSMWVLLLLLLLIYYFVSISRAPEVIYLIYKWVAILYRCQKGVRLNILSLLDRLPKRMCTNLSVVPHVHVLTVFRVNFTTLTWLAIKHSKICDKLINRIWQKLMYEVL